MAGNREYKSDVFGMLMEDPMNVLELYNAVNGSDYTDPTMVELCRLDGGISLSVRNDAAFILDMRLSIYEHQSTVCPNMPLRNFIYLAAILGRMIKNRNIYGRSLVKIPTPKFAVFYNGEEEQPERYELKLSDAFKQPVQDPELELRCSVYNINRGRNAELLESCPFLREYMIFVDYVRAYLAEDDFMDMEQAVEKAIDQCIKEGVLRDFLTERRAEVTKAMTLDYTFERQLQLEREEAVMQGLAEGLTKGETLNLIRLAYKKYVKNHTVEETADMLEEDAEKIQKIYKAIEAADTDDADKIYEQFLNMAGTSFLKRCQ